MPYIGKKPADIIATVIDTTTGTFSGEVDAGSLDVSGNADIDGITNLDNTDIDGTLDVSGNLTVDTNTLFVDSANNNVGIGTNSPELELHIKGSGNQSLRLETTDSTYIGFDIQQNSDGSGQILLRDSKPLIFYTNSSERMRIDNSGRVGIGVVPNTGWSGTWDAVQIGLTGSLSSIASGSIGRTFISDNAYNDSNSQSTSWQYQIADQASQIALLDGTVEFRVATAGSADADITWNQAVTLNNSGNVGIGLSSNIDRKLHVEVDNTYAAKFGGTAGGDFAIEIGQTGTNGSAGFNATGTGGAMKFSISGSEAMRIDDSRKFLVGKTSSGVANDGFEAQTTGQTIITQASADVLRLNRKTSDGTIIDLRKDGTTIGTIGCNSGQHLVIGKADTGLNFQANEIINPSNPSTGSVRDAAIDLGQSNGRFKDLYLSGGVYLGGTGSANKLDDYEEGTWTPTLAQYGGSPTITLANYTKVGRLVTATCRIVLSGFSDASHFQVNGLPFTAANFGGSVMGAFITYSTTTLSTPIRVLVGNNNTQASLYQSGGGNATYNDVGNSSEFRFMFVYMTA